MGNAAHTSMSDSHLSTPTGEYAVEIKLANNFFSRFRGLMFKKSLNENQGLLITRCPSVHSFFMRFSIDVIYLDSHGVVTRCAPCLKPWRASLGRSLLNDHATAHALEMSAGSIQRMHIETGSRLHHPCFS